MPSIISAGIGSGLDINSLVNQLVAVERAPLQLRLDRREAGMQAELSALGFIKSALAGFQSTLDSLTELESFQGRTAKSSDEDLFTTSAGSSAVRGTYAIEIFQLAQAHKLRSQAYASGAAVVGNGTLTISSGSETFNVTLVSGTDTLADIRSAINAATGNTSVLATLVNSISGTHLVVTSQTGAANAITVKASGGDGGLDDLIYDLPTTNLTEVDVAQDARIFVDGLQYDDASNTVVDVIEGVTVELLTADPGNQHILEVGHDRAVAKKSIESFVSSYNQLVSSIANQTRFDPETFVAGPLLGDSTVRAVSSQIRAIIGDQVDGLTGSVRALVDIGITSKLDGLLVIDAEKLDAAFDTDFDDVGRLFSGEDGYAVRIDALIESYLDDDGQFETRTEGLQARIDDLKDQRASLDRRMTATEARLRAQFNALDALVGQLNSTSLFLTQQLANLPGSTFSG